VTRPPRLFLVDMLGEGPREAWGVGHVPGDHMLYRYQALHDTTLWRYDDDGGDWSTVRVWQNDPPWPALVAAARVLAVDGYRRAADPT
jgi:hypothetical protein